MGSVNDSSVLENVMEDGEEGVDGVDEEMLSSEAIIAAGVTVSAREREAKRPWVLGWYFQTSVD